MITAPAKAAQSRARAVTVALAPQGGVQKSPSRAPTVFEARLYEVRSLERLSQFAPPHSPGSLESFRKHDPSHFLCPTLEHTSSIAHILA